MLMFVSPKKVIQHTWHQKGHYYSQSSAMKKFHAWLLNYTLILTVEADLCVDKGCLVDS